MNSPIHQKTCHVTYVCRSQIFCTTHLLKHTYPERVCPNAHGWHHRHACIDFGRQISDTSCLTQDYSHWADRMVIDLYTPFEFKAAEAWFCTTVPAICKGLSLMYRSIWPAAKIGWFIISVIHMVVQNRRLQEVLCYCFGNLRCTTLCWYILYSQNNNTITYFKISIRGSLIPLATYSALLYRYSMWYISWSWLLEDRDYISWCIQIQFYVSNSPTLIGANFGI